MTTPGLVLSPIVWMIGCKDAACTRTVSGIGRTTSAAELDCVENAAAQHWTMRHRAGPLAEVWRCPDHRPGPGPWQPANDGTAKRPWFLCRDADNIGVRFRYAKDGWRLVRYASYEAAQRAADRLNAKA